MKNNIYTVLFLGSMTIMLSIYAQQGTKSPVPPEQEALRKSEQSYRYRPSEQEQQKQEQEARIMRVYQAPRKEETQQQQQQQPIPEGKILKSQTKTNVQMMTTHPEE